MALMKSSLSQKLESVFGSKPDSTAQAASDWANAYLSYASSALSLSNSLPVTATANLSILVSAFTAAFQAPTSSGAASLMAQGVMGFWSAMVWAGPSAAGATASPGNMALGSALGAIFGDTSESSDAAKASQIADAFDQGAKLVMVSDITFSVPPLMIVGPIA